mgnify:CR=1 FL=1
MDKLNPNNGSSYVPNPNSTFQKAGNEQIQGKFLGNNFFWSSKKPLNSKSTHEQCIFDDIYL